MNKSIILKSVFDIIKYAEVVPLGLIIEAFA
jgi:hypothetical protein